MKTCILNFAILIMFAFSVTAFADEEVVEVGVPIVVTGETYTVVEKPDYYYYQGHRCYVEKREGVGVNFLGLRAGVDGGSEIYCYPYP